MRKALTSTNKRLLTAFLIGTLLFAPPSRQQSKAYLLPLCVAVVALIVGGVAVYTIYSCAKKAPPPPPPPPDEGDKKSPAKSSMVPGGAGGGLNITIEMSPDLIHWQAVGVCRNTALTDFVFYHTNSLPRAFYRAAIY